MRSAAPSRDVNLSCVRSKLTSRGEGPALFEQWGSPLEETRALLLIERSQTESLQIICDALLPSIWILCPLSGSSFALQSRCNLRSKVELSHRLWTVRRYGDAGLLCAGKAKPVVHLCLRSRLCVGIDLWLSAGRMAIWCGGSCVVSSGAASLVVGAVRK